MGFIFNRKKKVSKDGTKVDVISYGDEDRREWTPPAQSGVYLDEIQAHIDKIYPCKEKEPYVYHEIASDIVHIDVNVIPPEGERDYYVLWTSGMSDLPMDLPDGSRNPKEYNRPELALFLDKVSGKVSPCISYLAGNGAYSSERAGICAFGRGDKDEWIFLSPADSLRACLPRCR